MLDICLSRARVSNSICEGNLRITNGIALVNCCSNHHHNQPPQSKRNYIYLDSAWLR